jgi:putative methionine-R-sulfoxide reductase with GAF domain
MQEQGSNQPLGLTDVVRQLYRDCSRALDASICFFGVYDAAAQRVDVVWQVHDGVELPGGAFPLGSGLTSQVIRDRQARLVQDWSREGPTVQVQYATVPPDLPQSAITVPVVADGRVLGVTSVQYRRPNAFEPRHLELVQRLVDGAAPAIAVSLQAEQPARADSPAAAGPEASVALADDAALTVDNEGRLVHMNNAARALLSLGEHSVVFGYPIDRQQAGHWPLGSSMLGEALRSILDRLQGGEASVDAEIVPPGDPERVVRCNASLVFEVDRPAGAVMTFCAAVQRRAA